MPNPRVHTRSLKVGSAKIIGVTYSGTEGCMTTYLPKNLHHYKITSS